MNYQTPRVQHLGSASELIQGSPGHKTDGGAGTSLLNETMATKLEQE